MKINIDGSCSCGAIQYKITGPTRDIIACHCFECRKISGHFTAATATRPGDLIILNDTSLAWYKSSDTAERGFCSVCGSAMFWKPVSGDRISVYAGTIDGKTGLQLTSHIHLSEKGDYYTVEETDNIECHLKGGANLRLR